MSEGMILRRGGGGGGSAFSIQTYPSDFPASAKEGTIGILTSVAFPLIVISPLEPNTPSEGTIWISVGTSAQYPVSTGKKQVVTICPVKVQQYVSGSWTVRTAKTFASGAWHDWAVVFINGTVATGMELSSYNFAHLVNGSTPTVTFEDGSYCISFSDGSRCGSVVSSAKYNLSAFSKLKVTLKSSNVSGYSRFGVGTTKGDYDNYTSISVLNSYTDLELDTSGLTEDYYVGVGIANTSNTLCKIFIKSLVLEP